MADLLIHIGSHKTGTTTIQNALRELSKKKQYDNWTYIKSPKSAANIMCSQQYDSSVVSRFRHELQKKIGRKKPSEYWVLSSEALIGNPNQGYLNSGIAAKMLRDATQGYKVKIVVYLRRQDDFAESMYTQNIHEGESLGFDEFIKGFNSVDSLNYTRILGDFADAFGDENLIVKSYHDASDKGILLDFGEIINCTSLVNASNKRKNPSYSRQALELAKLCNSELDRTKQRSLRTVLQSTMAKNRGEQFSFFSLDDRAEFLDKYETSNREITKRYFQVNGENIFSSFRGAQSDDGAGHLSYEQVSRLVTELLNLKMKRRSVISKLRTYIRSFKDKT